MPTELVLSPTLQARFDSGYEVLPSGCHEWKKAKSNGGYGMISIAPGVARGAHTVALFLRDGAWPEGLVLHTCDNPACCNPDHLRVGTQKENRQDAKQKGRVPAGEGHHNSKLTDSEVENMRQKRREGATLKSLAVEFGITISSTHCICTGKTRNLGTILGARNGA